MITSYSHDIFVSYSRLPKWPDWVKDWFVPLLEQWVGTELGREVRVFVDTTLDDGTDWPIALANALGDSRMLIPLVSRLYINSKWCRAELSHMLSREEACRLRSPDNPEGLIVPASIHGKGQLPLPIGARIQINTSLQNYTAVMNKTSPRHEELSDAIRLWAPQIAEAIGRAPPYDPRWRSLARAKFEALLQQPTPVQDSVPSLGGP